MKKRSISVFSGLALSLLIITGCQKSNSPAVKTKTDLITQANWKFSVAMVGTSDVSSLLKSCEKDNILTFTSAGTGTVDEGPTKCNSSDPQVNPFTWNFASSETVLHISAVLFTGGSSDFTLVSLTETQLVVSQAVNISGTSQSAVVTFIH
jgi:hypothetical protein